MGHPPQLESFRAPLVPPPTTAGPLATRLHRAHARRATLASDNDCYRIHDAAEAELPGVTVERYGSFGVIHDYAASDPRLLLDVGNALCELGAAGVYLKQRERGDSRKRPSEAKATELPLAGEAAPSEFEVHEHGRRYWVRLADGPSTGLFVDQRENRTRLAETARGKRVLNLFCYTGSFSVAAGLGGAIRITSVDSSRAALARVNGNLRLNALDPAFHRVLRADAVEYLARAARGSERFDVIVLDPPTFSSHNARTFRARSQYESMASDCFRLLDDTGHLLAVTNDRGSSRADFRSLIETAAERAGRKLATLEAPPPPVDCPLGDDPEAATKSLWAVLR